MSSVRTLEINGYRDEPVPNTLFQQPGSSTRMAVILPGIRYMCKMPLLYYLTSLLFELGADVLWVEYEYDQRPDFQALSYDEQRHWVLSDATAACHAALASRPYRDVTLAGKSLGTLALGYLLTREPEFAQSRAIWLTPLLNDKVLRAQLRQAPQRSLVVIGTNDKQYDPSFLEELKALSNVKAVILQGADHSLEIKGELSSSIKLMGDLMREIELFVSESRSKRP